MEEEGDDDDEGFAGLRMGGLEPIGTCGRVGDLWIFCGWNWMEGDWL